MTTTEKSSTKLVDLEVLQVIYDAANARLAKVRDNERNEHGVAKTDLTDVGRAALVSWGFRPDTVSDGGRRKALVSIVPAGGPATGTDGFVAKCSLCPAEFPGNTRAQARSGARGHAASHTRTFRFSMDRQTYDKIKKTIQGKGLSVASVVQDGLETFARTGKF